MGFLNNLRQYDRLWIGIILGLVLPLILYYILQPLNPEKYDLMPNELKTAMLKMLPMLLSRCVFPNALIFFLLIWNNFDLTAKGILYSTMFLTAILIAIHFIF